MCNALLNALIYSTRLRHNGNATVELFDVPKYVHEYLNEFSLSNAALLDTYIVHYGIEKPKFE